MRHYPVAQNVAKSPARGVGCKLIGSVFKGAANKLSMSYQFSFYISIAHAHMPNERHIDTRTLGRKRAGDADVGQVGLWLPASWGFRTPAPRLPGPCLSKPVLGPLSQLSCNCSPLIAFVCQAELFTFIIISTPVVCNRREGNFSSFGNAAPVKLEVQVRLRDADASASQTGTWCRSFVGFLYLYL